MKWFVKLKCLQKLLAQAGMISALAQAHVQAHGMILQVPHHVALAGIATVHLALAQAGLVLAVIQAQAGVTVHLVQVHLAGINHVVL